MNELAPAFDTSAVTAPKVQWRNRKTERLLVQHLRIIPAPIMGRIERFLVATVDLSRQDRARLHRERVANLLALKNVESADGVEGQVLLESTCQHIEFDIDIAFSSRAGSIDLDRQTGGMIGYLYRVGDLVKPSS